ncbi:disease resistance protein RML1A-like [Vicia villosa]|uniref:disease resistance protein RML1A-like n=1 Tax=Vicia villosa TaxID=3911 RepID=UPI00273A7914|nr:disease resistance protein RML1A-like [Vicia villosa]
MLPGSIFRRTFSIEIMCFIVCLLLVSLLGEAATASAPATTNIKDSVIFNPQIKYDVFVSFRGSDIRQGFLSHLIEAITRKKIFAFVDTKVHKGDKISPSLVQAIKTSLISLVIFSENYASSSWCLDELVKIVECKHKDGQIILPVFFKVTPTDVRHQKGSYAVEFAKHEKKYNLSRVQQWRSALKESGNILGYHASNFPSGALLVEEIISDVMKRLDHVKQVHSKGLIGVGKQIPHVESLLKKGSKDVRAIGIWGMSGIGKTTIAEQVYSRLCSEYEGCYFKANVREEWGRHGAMKLKNDLFSTLLGEQDLKIDTPHGLPGFVERRLRRMKVLLALDDVNDIQQLEVLIETLDWFGKGSRIIITTRDKQVLVNMVDDNDIYEVKALDFDDSFRLFTLNAFGQNHFKKEYYELSDKMVNYAKGIPLVLEVLGRHLRGKDKKIWESQLLRLTKVPIKRVNNVVNLSYNGLDRHEKKILLDIACFFDGLHLKVDQIKLLVKDHGYSVDVELESLKNKALITISQDNVISMHSIIQETAWEIVREESIDDPGKQSRLLDPDDIYHVLKSNKGSEVIRSLAIDLSIIKDLQLNPKVFEKMNRLQYLDIYSKGYSCDVVQSRGGLYLPQGLESLPNELRYLRWAHFPLESLPSNFSSEKLVVLDLQHSRVRKLWHEDKDLVNLKYLKLGLSKQLVELPDLSNATNLEVIDLRVCTGLISVHPSVFTLNKLEKLDLGGCISLRSFRSNIHLSSLRYLSLAGCRALKEFSVTSKEMVKLNLELTRIKQLPSIGLLTKLEKLLLAQSYIENLAESIKLLTRLRHLDLRYCWKLRSLPELPSSLITLDASGCESLENVTFPSTALQMLKENKTRVAFWNCLKLDEHSLKAIGLNAKINMMKFAHKHISISRHNYDAQGTYVYPGSNVPEWLVYRTTGDYMTIDLSFANHSSSLGFIFCFIVPQVPSQGFILRFNIGVDEGEDIQWYLDRPSNEIKSDHVYLIYDVGFSRYLSNRVKDQPKFKIKVTAESRTLTSEYESLMMLRGFGVSPISTSQYFNLIQHIEVAEGPSIPTQNLLLSIAYSLLLPICIELFLKFVL